MDKIELIPRNKENKKFLDDEYERLKKERLRSRLVLQVHDELIIEAHKDEAEYISRLIVEEMSKAADLSVPLVAEAGIGDDWYEAKS